MHFFCIHCFLAFSGEVSLSYVTSLKSFLLLCLQVLNQTSRLEIQLLENSLSTNKLEKELMIQTNEISKLHDKNR